MTRFCTSCAMVLLASFGLGMAASVQAKTSDEYLKDAQEYAEKGDLNSAIIQLKNAVKEDPKNTQARFQLGLNYLLRGDGAGAEKEFERARSLGMAMQELAIPLGTAYLMQNKADKVLAEIKPEKAYPNNIQSGIYVLHANAHLALNAPDKARSAFQEAVRLDPASPNALLGQARMAVGDKQFDTAQELASRVQKDHPNNGDAWAVLGEIARLKGDYPRAKQNFDKAVDLSPTNFPAMLGSAIANIALGDTATAKNRIDRILRLVPNHPMANYLHAVLQFQQKNLTGAAEALQVALRVMPDHTPSLQLMGTIDFAGGRFEQAAQSLTRVVHAAPKNIPAGKLLAATHLKLQQPAKAIKVLEDILASAPQDAQLLALMGTAYIQNKQTEKGTEYLERAVEAAPDAAGIHTQLALGRLASGDTSQAVKELEAAVDLGQNVFQADVMLIMIHLRKGEYQKALAQAQEFAKKLPDSPLPYNLMGAASMGINDSKAARQSFEQALKKDPGFLSATLNLGRLDESEGKLDSARDKYLSVLKKQEGNLGALMSLARIAEQQGSEEQALNYYETAWKSNSSEIQPGLVLIEYFNRKRQPLRAISIAREMKVQHPNNPAVLNALGMSQMAAKDYHNAKNTFAEMVKLLPQSDQAYFLLGQANLALQDAAAARDNFKKAISITKDFLPAQLAMASLELKSNRTGEALQIAQTIQKQRPAEMAGYRLEGDVWMSKGDFTKAADVFQHAQEKFKAASLAVAIYEARKQARVAKPYQSLEAWLKDHPDDLTLRIVLGGAYQDEGRFEAAISQYDLVLKARPDDVTALNNRAWAAHKLKQPDAVKYAERAYGHAADNPAVMDTYGWLLVETGDAKRGLALLQDAVAKAPHLAEVRYHMAVGLHKAGRNAEAKTELKRVLEMDANFPEADKARSLLSELDHK